MELYASKLNELHTSSKEAQETKFKIVNHREPWRTLGVEFQLDHGHTDTDTWSDRQKTLGLVELRLRR